jgi:hypothetical protein
MYSNDFFAAVREEKRKLLERVEGLDAILGDLSLVQEKEKPSGKRVMSAEARQKIADAQRKRWDKVRKAKK